MKIFLSYASEHRDAADQIAINLRSGGHKVFLDKDDLPKGKTFDDQIRTAINQCDLFLFLITPESVTKGRYTLTELALVRKRWSSPGGRVLPVLVSPTDVGLIPPYLRSVTFLEPEGSMVAEVADSVARLDSRHAYLRVLRLTAAGVGLVTTIFIAVLASLHFAGYIGAAPTLPSELLSQTDAARRVAEQVLVKVDKQQESARQTEARTRSETAWASLRRAIQEKAPSDQGQVAALTELVAAGTKFGGYDLSGVYLAEAQLPKVTLTGANLRLARLERIRAGNSDFSRAVLAFARLEDAQAPASNFDAVYASFLSAEKVVLKGSTLRRASLVGADLRNADLTDVDLTGANLSYADLRGAKLRGATLRNAILLGTLIGDADFSGATLDNTDLTASIGNNKLGNGVCSRRITGHSYRPVSIGERYPSAKFNGGYGYENWQYDLPNFPASAVSSTSHWRLEPCAPLRSDEVAEGVEINGGAIKMDDMVALRFERALLEVAGNRNYIRARMAKQAELLKTSASRPDTSSAAASSLVKLALDRLKTAPIPDYGSRPACFDSEVAVLLSLPFLSMRNAKSGEIETYESILETADWQRWRPLFVNFVSFERSQAKARAVRVVGAFPPSKNTEQLLIANTPIEPYITFRGETPNQILEAFASYSKKRRAAMAQRVRLCGRGDFNLLSEKNIRNWFGSGQADLAALGPIAERVFPVRAPNQIHHWFIIVLPNSDDARQVREALEQESPTEQPVLRINSIERLFEKDSDVSKRAVVWRASIEERQQ